MKALPQKQTQVFFFKVKHNQEKLKTLCEITQKHFEQKQPILIAVPNQESAEYLDKLLWKMPEISFVPHQIVNTPSSEKVVIAISCQENFNLAQVLLNLCPDISPIWNAFALIYELDDETDPLKKELSNKKKLAYKNFGQTLTDINHC